MRGTKRPAIPNWTNFNSKKQHVSKWLTNGKADSDIGILTANNPTVDIDISDEDVTLNLLEFVTANYGRGIWRTGQRPKMSVTFKCDAPFDKVTSPVYISPDGKKNQVEILGNGQYIKCIGIHPTTKEHYSFNGKPTVANTKSSDLPVLTEQDAHDIIEAFCNMVPDDWTAKSNAVVQEQQETDDDDIPNLDNLVPPCDLTFDEVVAYMEHVPAGLLHGRL